MHKVELLVVYLYRRMQDFGEQKDTVWRPLAWWTPGFRRLLLSSHQTHPQKTSKQLMFASKKSSSSFKTFSSCYILLKFPCQNTNTHIVFPLRGVYKIETGPNDPIFIFSKQKIHMQVWTGVRGLICPASLAYGSRPTSRAPCTSTHR